MLSDVSLSLKKKDSGLVSTERGTAPGAAQFPIN